MILQAASAELGENDSVNGDLEDDISQEVSQEEMEKASKIFDIIEENLAEGVGEPLNGITGGLYGEEIFNIYTLGGAPVGHAVTENKTFTELAPDTVANATMNIFIDEGETAAAVFEAENPLDKFYELKGDGKIKMDPVGVGKTIKYFFTNIVGTVVSWFT